MQFKAINAQTVPQDLFVRRMKIIPPLAAAGGLLVTHALARKSLMEAQSIPGVLAYPMGALLALTPSIGYIFVLFRSRCIEGVDELRQLVRCRAHSWSATGRILRPTTRFLDCRCWSER